MSVIVAVRVRPFNAREVELNSQLCVKMHDKTTTLIDENGGERHFTFDYSFWSHDNFTNDNNGYSYPTNNKYADQKHVYGTVGNTVLQNALDGYHCCLFAYGQTGSGKSYSMIGYGANRGIVPMISEELFKTVQRETSPAKFFEVNVSMIEIYNEKIQDLLIPINKRPLGGLKVRESKTVGVYVEDLSKHPVDSYDSIEQKMADGNQNRTIAATQMNSSSSRAHTIITIEFKQFEIIDGKKVERLSVINLVDLAGSEKVAKTGATGDRLKEGCSINKSLTVLGLVISTLADKATNKNNSKVVPYRDSALTRILQNALGGNSKTLMICAISPSSNNYEESLSTLRYADQAKKIKLHAVVNESETDKKIRELQKENEELKKILMQVRGGNLSFLGSTIDGILPEMSKVNVGREPQKQEEEENKAREFQIKIQELEKALKSNDLMLKEYEKTFEEKLKEEQEKQVKKEVNDYSSVHLINLNEDPMLCGQIYHNLERINPLYVGRKNGDPSPHIVLHAIGIQTNHARIEREGESYYLVPNNKEAGDFLYINGVNVYERRKLKHCDRIVFGISSFFIFKDPHDATLPEGFLSEADIDWEHCQLEMSKRNASFNNLLGPDSETQKNQQARFQDIEQEVERMKMAYEEEMRAMKEEHAKKMEEIQQQQSFSAYDGMDKEELIQMEMQKYEQFRDEFEQNYTRQIELEKAKKELIEKEVMQEFREKDKKKLESKMLKIHPNIIEVNLIAQELKRNISFSMHISYFYIDFDNINKYEKQKKYRIKVRVDNHELGYYYFWDLAKFTSRYFLIKELLEKFYETNKLAELTQDQDPFWDPPEHQKVGEGFLKLMSLAYLMDNPNELILVGDEGKSGLLNVDLVPCDEKGRPLEPDDPIFEDFIDDPNDLLHKRLVFSVKVG